MEMDSMIENNEVSAEKTANIDHKMSQIENVTTFDITKIDAAKRWTSFWLRKRVLIAFIVVFVAIFVALQVLYSISERDHGLTTSNDDYHYLWTYGPTGSMALCTTIKRNNR